MPSLAKQSEDENPNVRENAARFAGEELYSKDPVVVILLGRAINDNDPLVQSATVVSLATIEDIRSVEPLVFALDAARLEKTGWLQKTIADGSGAIGDERAILSLIASLKDREAFPIIDYTPGG